ncbi:outer membrane beta-barrel protein [Hymenobacter sp. BT507]|uniref:Outer membrane beta-barrel protein n=1 Tax=Hymenobacter citatus TaxID=2763506 RepID=A0ABR7MIS7_9BACT|nr:DUF6089 family protein [Hymenobacter citatus]MBC6610996.1 outer membrane beta-barrel protein [Hymenobacter citatus]
MRKNYVLFLLTAASLGVAPVAQAQSFTKSNQYLSVGASLSAFNYFGDLTPRVSFASVRMAAVRPGFGFHATHRLTPYVSVRGALSFGRIAGSDQQAAGKEAAYRYYRNLNFTSSIQELSVVGIFDLVPNHSQAVNRMPIVPYVFGGVAGFHFNPKGTVDGGTVPAGLKPGAQVELQPLRTEGRYYHRAQLAIPFGAGVRLKVAKSVDVGIELGWRKTFTDYLDDVSTTYVSTAGLSTPAARYFGHSITRTDQDTPAQMDVPGALRGNSAQKDWYITTGVSVSYILKRQMKTNKFR